jgi:Tfp pilus assembly protein PilF
VVVFLVGLVAGCAADKENRRRESQASYQLALAFLNEGRPAPALKELHKAATLAPDDPEIQNALGLAYWARREFALAEEALKRAVELKADYSEAWNNLGALYLDEGRYGDAVTVLEQALANVFYGTQERALTNLGYALFKTGRLSDAEQRLRQALEINAVFPLAHKFLGMLLQSQDRHEEALVEFDLAARSFPVNALGQLSDVHRARGVSFFELGDRAAAKAAFEESWRLGPRTESGQAAKNYLKFLE